jgi:hypothetical protein
MATYQLVLHDSAERAPARQRLNADDDEEAVTVSSLVAGACSDVCTSYEIWDRHRLVLSAPSGGGDRTIADLSERQQQIVIACEVALRDSRSCIAESKKLLNRIDALILAMGHLR